MKLSKIRITEFHRKVANDLTNDDLEMISDPSPTVASAMVIYDVLLNKPNKEAYFRTDIRYEIDEILTPIYSLGLIKEVVHWFDQGMDTPASAQDSLRRAGVINPRDGSGILKLSDNYEEKMEEFLEDRIDGGMLGMDTFLYIAKKFDQRNQNNEITRLKLEIEKRDKLIKEYDELFEDYELTLQRISGLSNQKR